VFRSKGDAPGAGEGDVEGGDVEAGAVEAGEAAAATADQPRGGRRSLAVPKLLACDGSAAAARRAARAARARRVLVAWASMLPGGLLTGYIGISVEKVLFVLLASGALGRREHVRSAAITSVTFVGWLSGISP